MIEMHLFDADAMEEEALCEAEASVLDLTTVQDYLERRGHDLSLPTVCNHCKVSAIPFARMRRSALAAEGRTDEGETYRRLADTLSRETDPSLSGDWTGKQARSSICGRFFICGMPGANSLIFHVRRSPLAQAWRLKVVCAETLKAPLLFLRTFINRVSPQ